MLTIKDSKTEEISMKKAAKDNIQEIKQAKTLNELTVQEETIQRCQDELEKAIASKGFLITITRSSGDNLEHFQARVNFRNDDVLPSVDHIRENIRQELGQDYKNLELRTFN